MSTVITVENLGKRYTLHHQQREQYTALRDVITNGVASLGKKLIHPFRSTFIPHPSSLVPTSEDFWALKDVSFEVKQGDRIGIIGRNGAGKSTLLKILSRITEPTTGSVRIKGRVASLLEVGTGFHPELTGRENIFLNGAILGMGRAEIKKKFDEIVDFAEIEKFLDTPVKRYSSGMYVRLAFAVAAHLEPEILIVDEVLAVGDVQFQKKCLGKMEEVSVKEGRTVLFVSHNLAAIRTFCSKAMLMRQGLLTANGTTEETVKQYLGEISTINFLVEWNEGKSAPQNQSILLRRVVINDANCIPMFYLSTDLPFNITIDFSVKKNGAYAGLTVLLYDSQYNLIFSSINNHETSWYGKAMPTGNYTSKCMIPANLLNNGLYQFNIIIFGQNFADAVTVTEVLKFEVLDGPAVRGDFFGVIGGVIRPLLQWHTSVQ